MKAEQIQKMTVTGHIPDPDLHKEIQITMEKISMEEIQIFKETKILITILTMKAEQIQKITVTSHIPDLDLHR